MRYCRNPWERNVPEIELVVCAGDNAKGPPGHKEGRVALYRIVPEEGQAVEITRSLAAPSPSFLAWSAAYSTVYVASERAKGDGLITPLRLENEVFTAGQPVETGGNSAVYLSLDRQERYVFAANYQADDTSGPVSVAGFALEENGAMGAMSGSAGHSGHGPDKSRQSRPHCHSVMVSPDNKFLVAADLGTDSLYFYRLEKGALSLEQQLKLPAGTGPRHSVFHPSRPHLYVTGELNSSLVTVALNDPARVIASVDATALDTEDRNYPSGIAITPDGHYVLVANRGADTIAVFWVDPETGIARLRREVPCGDRFPRAIRFDPKARLLAVANQRSGDISIFAWDFFRGELSEKPLIKLDIPMPLDMAFTA